MIFLPDVNVWLALVAAEHVHSAEARAFVEEEASTLALCRVTHMAILRLLTNPHVMGLDVKTPQQAWEISDRLLAAPNVIMEAEPNGLDAAWKKMTPTRSKGSNFWTDAYLAAFAQVTGYPVVTFDRGFSGYPNIPVKLLGTRRH